MSLLFPNEGYRFRAKFLKDLFSEQSSLYAKHRPSYPASLFDYIFSFVHHREKAWDCATGNGQAAVALAKDFKKVERFY